MFGQNTTTTMKNIIIIIIGSMGCLSILLGTGITGFETFFWVGIATLVLLWVFTSWDKKDSKRPDQDQIIKSVFGGKK